MFARKEKHLAIASPIQAVFQGITGTHARGRLAQERVTPTETGGLFGLRAQKSLKPAALRRRKTRCGAPGGTVGALVSHHPLHHADQAQMRPLGDQIAHLDVHLFHGTHRVNTPAHPHFQGTAAVADGGGALRVLHVVHHITRPPGRGRKAPALPRSAVL